ncbi:MAG: tetratricopeptide repeat protein [Candidatus Magasanikbacteria bacterium]
MYSILPFILILFSLTVIVIVIVRKFPQLTLLDVESIPVIKMNKKKDEFLKKKAEKKAEVVTKKQKEMIKPLFRKLKDFQSWFRKVVLDVYHKTQEKKVSKKNIIVNNSIDKVETDSLTNKEDDIKKLIIDGERALQDKDLELAENKFIEAIRIDSKNKGAYFGLANVYIEKEEWDDAGGTLEFLLKIDPENAKVLLSLAQIFEKKDDLEKAVEYYERAAIADDSRAETFDRIGDLLLDINQCESALEAMRQANELEPENQTYLDKIIDISVKCGNKQLADEYYQKLRMLDPDNNRLTVLRGKIDSD